MPVFALTILSSLGTVAVHMLSSLATEAFLKKAIVLGLEKISARTETDVDNKLLDAAKEAWGK